jgi:hypothetical protein
VALDHKEAACWFKLAADQGIGAAAAVLAKQCATGEGLPQDLVEAYKWAAVAAWQPDPNSGEVTLRELQDKLTPDQLAEAQRRVKELRRGYGGVTMGFARVCGVSAPFLLSHSPRAPHARHTAALHSWKLIL